MNTSQEETAIAPPGLAGLVVADTAVGDVRGEEGFFHYGPHDATHLARNQSFEAVWHLLTTGSLPTDAELEAFAKLARDARLLDDDLEQLVRSIARASGLIEPLGALRTAISATGAIRGLRPWLDRDSGVVESELFGVAAAVPSLIAAMWSEVHGTRAIHDPGASVAADLLRAVTGREPAAQDVVALERYLILTMDHGFNASTFAARAVTSTAADVCAAMTAGMASLSGPLHGGAPALVLDMLAEIGTPERARGWVRAKLDSGERIMGFGHRVYRTEDPRSALLKETALANGGGVVELAVEVEKVVLEELDAHRPDRALRTNVEFYAGVVLDQIGLPQPLFTGAFAVSRAVGWSAHIMEQITDNKIIRPSSRYVGPAPSAGAAA